MLVDNTSSCPDEKELIRQAQAGCNSALQSLISNNKRFLRKLSSFTHLAKEVGFAGLEYQFYKDDFFQLAQIAFVEAIRSFDLSRNLSLRTYAYWKVHNSLRDFIKEWKNFSTHSIEDSNDNFLFSHSIITPSFFDEPDVVDDSAVWQQLDAAGNILTSLEENVFLLHLHLNMKGKEIAQRLNISPARVSVILTNAKNKLKLHFRQQGYKL